MAPATGPDKITVSVGPALCLFGFDGPSIDSLAAFAVFLRLVVISGGSPSSAVPDELWPEVGRHCSGVW
ncbi:MAG: hypothetical protein J07HX64_02729 [halophilic archaeon J07HX64]|jgi:hypothetical protein|nr:MAG: hypothetical protein J07HX64_02729 [halophilic archaeon J07HX64]